MSKKKLTPEQEKEVKMLLESNSMYEKTKRETRIKGKNKEVLSQIEFAQDDIRKQIEKIDPELAKDMKIQSEIKDSPLPSPDIFDTEKDKQTSVFDVIEKDNIREKITDTTTIVTPKTPEKKSFDSIPTGVQYDIIPLPSKGQGYKNKMERIPVGYLTAYDENLITSPNLYRDGLVIDFLLRNKVMDKNIDTDQLLKGDVDAIILFLRATSYGPEFPISARDPKSGKYFDTVVDLSQIKTKEFTLIGDENGHFPYKLDNGDEIKFKYLTRKEEKMLEKITEIENDGAMALTLKSVNNTIINCLNRDEVLSSTEKENLNKLSRNIALWIEKLEESTELRYNKTVTNRMEMQIVSVNGNEDRTFIKDYVHNMRAGDSLKLRRYIIENEPGLDFDITIERPEDLGGGSFTTFLEWGDNVFLSIA